MKIAISTDHGRVSAHFGRCPSYTIVDIQGGNIAGREEIPNPGHTPGFLPHFLHERGVEAIIAGGMGPRAQGLFAEQNIQTIIGIGGTVDETIDLFIKGDLQPGQDLCEHGQGHGLGEPDRQELTSPAERPVIAEGGLICVTAQGGNLEAELDPRFGRAPYFIFVDPRTWDFEAVPNPHTEASHGAGIQAAQLVVEKHPAVVLTGRVGPNASRVLESARVRVMTTDLCTVREAVTRFQAG